MSKTKEINDIAQGIADITVELMRDSIDWQISDQPVSGRAYNELHDYVMKKSIEYMYIDLVMGGEANVAG
jgi:hypothetical protein